MTALLVVAYVAAGLVAFALFCRSDLREDGFVTRGAVIFYGVLSLGGPVALLVALMVAGIARLQSGFFAEPLWPKKDKDQ